MNPNKHPKDQIVRLAEILKYQGWRYPIKLSSRSGYITSGHGRVEAAKLLGLESVPCQYQDYESEDQELADIISDNAIASWSDLDLSFINSEIIPSLSPEFNLDLFGINNFRLDPVKLPEPKKLKCPSCGHEWGKKDSNGAEDNQS